VCGVCHPFAFGEQKGATMSMVRRIFGGVDTHADIHVAAVIDSNGGMFGVENVRGPRNQNVCGSPT
jgi:hypothetical protein